MYYILKRESSAVHKGEADRESLCKIKWPIAYVHWEIRRARWVTRRLSWWFRHCGHFRGRRSCCLGCGGHRCGVATPLAKQVSQEAVPGPVADAGGYCCSCAIRILDRVGRRLLAHRTGRRGLEGDGLEAGPVASRSVCCQLTIPLSREPALPRRTGRAAVCWSCRSSSELERADRLRQGLWASKLPSPPLPSPVASMSARPESRWSQGLRNACCFSSSPSMRRLSISSISRMDSLRSSTNLHRSCSLRAFRVISALSSTR